MALCPQTRVYYPQAEPPLPEPTTRAFLSAARSGLKKFTWGIINVKPGACPANRALRARPVQDHA